MNNEIKVFSYLRVSTAQQIDGDGYPRQREAVERLAAVKGWAVLREFVEQQTGTDSFMDRPKLMEAMDLCGGNLGVTIIVVERVDRLGRDLIVTELFFAECKKRGITVYAADSGEELVNAEEDPTRKLIRQILGALSEWDRSQINRKLQAGRRRKALETGKPCGGPEPFGKESHQKEALALIWRLVQDDFSCQDIADRLVEVGHSNPRGGKDWSRFTVHKIVKRLQNL